MSLATSVTPSRPTVGPRASPLVVGSCSESFPFPHALLEPGPRLLDAAPLCRALSRRPCLAPAPAEWR